MKVVFASGQPRRKLTALLGMISQKYSPAKGVQNSIRKTALDGTCGPE